MVNFLKKCSALKISSVVRMLLESNVKGFYLVKYFLGGRLAHLREKWTFMRDEASPSALSPTPFYDHVLTYLQKLRTISTNWPTLVFSARNIYACVLSIDKEVPSCPYSVLAC